MLTDLLGDTSTGRSPTVTVFGNAARALFTVVPPAQIERRPGFSEQTLYRQHEELIGAGKQAVNCHCAPASREGTGAPESRGDRARPSERGERR